MFLNPLLVKLAVVAGAAVVLKRSAIQSKQVTAATPQNGTTVVAMPTGDLRTTGHYQGYNPSPARTFPIGAPLHTNNIVIGTFSTGPTIGKLAPVLPTIAAAGGGVGGSGGGTGSGGGGFGGPSSPHGFFVL